jgi:hypothetical protein
MSTCSCNDQDDLRCAFRSDDERLDDIYATLVNPKEDG